MDETTKRAWQQLREEKERQDRQFAEVIAHLHSLGDVDLVLPSALLQDLEAAARPQSRTQLPAHAYQLRA